MNSVSGPFSDFPKTFGLVELKKGYFPHFFNTKENENYIGPLPSMNMYGYDAMSNEKREDFIKWYAEKVKDLQTYAVFSLKQIQL